MRKLGLDVNALKSSKSIKFVCGAALIALKSDALADGLAFGHAVRALIKDPVKTIRPEGLIYLDLVVLLPLEVV